nr:MAG TPA: hypothetical protein [Caudoviricetes sp.]
MWYIFFSIKLCNEFYVIFVAKSQSRVLNCQQI